MTISLDQLAEWMSAPEDRNLEFKAARNQYDIDKLIQYCCALANEGGGCIIFGVTDRRPRSVTGTSAFENIQEVERRVVEKLRLRVDASVLTHPDGRVVIFDVSRRPAGVPIQYNGTFWMRAGESLVTMTTDVIKRILDEGQPDFSAEVCAELEMADLDHAAIERLRKGWSARAPLLSVDDFDDSQLLRDADLYIAGRGLTWAALILLGRTEAVRRLLPQAEVVWEYREHEDAVPFDARVEFHGGVLTFIDDLLDRVGAHNPHMEMQIGDERRTIRAINEVAVREAVVNAVAHRDYRMYSSTFVRQWPTHLDVSSPGGFLPEVTAETILFAQSPRNRRLAEALVRCGFADRSGQGADRMFVASVQEGKQPPDFSGTTDHSVAVVLHGVVRDPAFVVFLERVTKETGYSLRLDDLVVLDAVHGERTIPSAVRQRVRELVRIGAVEHVESDRFVLARRFYELDGRPGEYTRRRGLDLKRKKALLEQHVAESGGGGVSLRELAQVLPGSADDDLRVLMAELCADGMVREVHFDVWARIERAADGSAANG